jgi:hypothetical protein
MANRQGRAGQFVSLLRELRYGCYRLLPSGELQATFDFNMPIYDAAMTNYVLIPEERSDLVQRLSGSA